MPRLNLFRLSSYLVVLCTILVTIYNFTSNKTYKKLTLRQIEHERKLLEENYVKKKIKEQNLLLEQKEKVINNQLVSFDNSIFLSFNFK